MPRYFFDLDNGKANFVDTIGTELNGPEMIRSDAIRFLATVFKDEAHDNDDPAYLASVRDEAGRVIFTTALTLQSNWRDTEGRVEAATIRSAGIAPAPRGQEDRT